MEMQVKQLSAYALMYGLSCALSATGMVQYPTLTVVGRVRSGSDLLTVIRAYHGKLTTG